MTDMNRTYSDAGARIDTQPMDLDRVQQIDDELHNTSKVHARVQVLGSLMAFLAAAVMLTAVSSQLVA